MSTHEFRIVEDFASVQGEGHYSGTYARFVRLSGCNGPARGLNCASWCDTDYEASRWTASVNDFDEWFGDQAPAPLLIFTGGEPLLYQDLILDWYNTSKYLDDDTQVCIETNGTIPREDLDIWHTVSPKGPDFGLSTGPISEIKLVVTPSMLFGAVNNVLDLMDGLKYRRQCELYLQPLDNDLGLAKDIVEDLISRRTEWKLSLQTHKLLLMP